VSEPLASSAARPAGAAASEWGADEAVHAALTLLGELREGHRRLEQRAQHVEAELCLANDALGTKVAELERLTRSLEAVLAAIPTGVVVRDARGCVTHVNQSAADILGTDGAAMLGAPVPACLAAIPVDGQRAPLATLDGRTRIVVRRESAVTLADGTAFGAVESLDDQTELAAAEERMRRLSRAAALGTMVGGVAHEVRNPLHAIHGFAELLEREVPPESRAARHAARIRAGVRDLEQIVASMLGVAGAGQLACRVASVRDIIAAAVESALSSAPAAAAGAAITVVGEDIRAEVDPIELRQALRNLVANALQAQGPGARVEITLASVADSLVVRVDDAGPRVPAETREHLFEPFYTTRADGTGLGLAIVRRIAELHGGTLTLQGAPSELGGASFVLTIPHLHRQAPFPQASATVAEGIER